MLINKKTVRKNKTLRKIQRDDKRTNRDRALERGSALKRNIGKVVRLSSEIPTGEPCATGELVKANISADELLSKLEAAGLTGNSGSGFPTAEKIKAFLSADVKNKYVVINGAECEPALVNDCWLMRNRIGEICCGAEVLTRALSPERVLLATRGSADYAADKSVIEMLKLPYQYPMGEEHILIAKALGIKLNVEEIPAEKGILVLNVQTVFQIGRIASGSYDGGRFVTLANLKSGEARVAYVHNDTNITELLGKTFDEPDATCYAGGGIGRAEKVDADAVFGNTTSFAAVVDETVICKESPCKKCGGCTKKCPMDVCVKDIVLARQDNPSADISGLGAEKCIKCGTCAYFCPAGKNPIIYLSENE